MTKLRASCQKKRDCIILSTRAAKSGAPSLHHFLLSIMGVVSWIDYSTMKYIVISSIFATVGAALLLWSAAFAPYKEIKIMQNAALEYPADIMDSDKASNKYRVTRKSQLTWKFRIQDYGLTSLVVSVLAASAIYFRKAQGHASLLKITTPKKRKRIIELGVAAAVLTLIAQVALLFLDFSRDEFPPWADSLGIPLMGMPFLLAFLLLIVGLFSAMGVARYAGDQLVINAFQREGRPTILWVVVFAPPMIFSLASVVYTVAVGDFLSVIPCMVWSMFFVLLFASKQRVNQLTSNASLVV